MASGPGAASDECRWWATTPITSYHSGSGVVMRSSRRFPIAGSPRNARAARSSSMMICFGVSVR